MKDILDYEKTSLCCEMGFEQYFNYLETFGYLDDYTDDENIEASAYHNWETYLDNWFSDSNDCGPLIDIVEDAEDFNEQLRQHYILCSVEGDVFQLCVYREKGLRKSDCDKEEISMISKWLSKMASFYKLEQIYLSSRIIFLFER